MKLPPVAKLPSGSMWRRVATALALFAGVVAAAAAQPLASAPPQTVVEDEHWQEMVISEELIHALGPPLKALAKGIVGAGVLPDERTRALFNNPMDAVDVRAGALAAALHPLGGRRLAVAEIAPAALVPVRLEAAPRLWAAALDGFASLDDASFAIARGRFLGGGRSYFTTAVLFAAGGTLRSGERAALDGQVDIRWDGGGPPVAGAPSEWKIGAWKTTAMRLSRAPAPLFEEALDRALPDDAQRQRARRSLHEEKARAKIRDPKSFVNPHPYFFVGSQDRHPGVAVVDIDGDGDDDLYLMERWGANQLLVNRGGGTFAERAAEFGLDIVDHCSAAVFADFDNDGDPDLFLGRTMVPSLYLENRDGRFVDRSAEVFPGGSLPALVSSVNAVDYDGDGLLDVYFSTYAAQMLVFDLKLHQARHPGQVAPPALLEKFLPLADARQVSEAVRSRGAHVYMSLPGPPNVLLKNEGTRFSLAPEPGAAKAFRNTYAAAWADYDRDGDPDVYLAHDFAPNQMLRNDRGRFVDVTEATQTADIGFGMGVGWGDYDRDGRQDLYVSNMYSKAGRRITEQFPTLDGRLRKMAGGNTLFRNRGDTASGDRFEHVSGLAAPRLKVEAAGWSWGGQFADFDNDGFLDLYVLSGYYTAPADVAVEVDT